MANNVYDMPGIGQSARSLSANAKDKPKRKNYRERLRELREEGNEAAAGKDEGE